jgi:hypothetical protein
MNVPVPSCRVRTTARRAERQTSRRGGRGERSLAAAAAHVAVAFSIGSCACSGAAPEAPTVARSVRPAPIEFEFPSAGEEAAVSSETTRGRATALVFITTFDLASQLVARRLGDVLVSFTPRANAAAVVVEAPAYAELLPTYRSTLSLPYPVVMADFATQQGAGPFGSVTHVPTLVVLDREGHEVWRHQGSVEPDEIRAALRRASAR